MNRYLLLLSTALLGAGAVAPSLAAPTPAPAAPAASVQAATVTSPTAPSYDATVTRVISYDATVTRVIDGDTVWLRPLRGGKPVKARAAGIDAPEACQPGGRQATRALRERLQNQPVQVTVRGRDDHGRLLVNLRHQGTDVWAEQVRQGHAWNSRYRRWQGPYAEQEREAREQRRGVWTAAAPRSPREFRRHNGACTRVATVRRKGSPHAPLRWQAAAPAVPT